MATPGPSEDIGFKSVKEVRSALVVPGSVVEKTAPWFTSANNDSIVILNQSKPSPSIRFEQYSPPRTQLQRPYDEGEEDEGLRMLVDVIFSEYPTVNGMLSIDSAKDVIRQWFNQQLGYEPGEGVYMNFFDNVDPSHGNLISREEMFANLKKLRN